MLWKALISSAILLATLSSVTLVAGIPATDPGSCLPTSNTTSPSDPSSNNTSTNTNSTSTNTNSTSTNTNSTTSINGTSSSGPQFVVYSDNWVTGTLPDVSQVEGYTVFALSFLLSTGAVDQAQGWAQLDENTRNELKSKYNAAGIKVVVSAFGSTETPTTAGADATKVAGDMATWVKQYGLDGIDVDYEDLAAMNAGDGKAEEWLSTFTTTLRGQLPQGQYILTHAPLAPWFSTQGFKSGAYLTVNKNVGDMIDWYNIQFYNQNEYNDCNGLLTQSSSTWPKSSLFEIAASGIDQNKLIIGKPATAADATNGYIAPATLATCLQQAKAKGWSGGAMVWQYPHADASWIKTVRSQSWAVGQ